MNWSLSRGASWLLSVVAGEGTATKRRKSFVRHPSSHLPSHPPPFHLLPRLRPPLPPLRSRPARASGRCTLDTSRRTGSSPWEDNVPPVTLLHLQPALKLNQTFYTQRFRKSDDSHRNKLLMNTFHSVGGIWGLIIIGVGIYLQQPAGLLRLEVERKHFRVADVFKTNKPHWALGCNPKMDWHHVDVSPRNSLSLCRNKSVSPLSPAACSECSSKTPHWCQEDKILNWFV